MPTTATSTWSASGRLDPLFNPDDAIALNVALAGPGTFQRGTVLGEVTATPGTYKPYAAANADGSQNPAVILMYTVTVDGSGNVTLAGEFGQTQKGVPAYMGGVFRTQELVGLDANAVTKLGGALVEGTVTSGIFRF